MAEDRTFTDNDAYFAMLKSMNEDMNIDPFSKDAIKAIDDKANSESTMRWLGMVYNFNGMNVQELKHPFFQQ